MEGADFNWLWVLHLYSVTGPPLPSAALHFSLCWPQCRNIYLDLAEKWLSPKKNQTTNQKNYQRKMTIEKSLTKRELSFSTALPAVAMLFKWPNVILLSLHVFRSWSCPMWSWCQTCHCTTGPWMMDALWWWWMQITILEMSGRNWFWFSLFSISGSRKASENAPVYSVGDLKFLLEKMCSGRAI